MRVGRKGICGLWGGLVLGVWAYRAQCTEGRLWLVGSDPCGFANNRVGKSRLICPCYFLVDCKARGRTPPNKTRLTSYTLFKLTIRQ